MGFWQFLADAYIGTAAFALARRSGIVAPARLENVQNPTLRKFLERYLWVGETSVENVELARRAWQRSGMGAHPGSPGSQIPKEAIRKATSQTLKNALGGAEDVIRKIRNRLK
eukprot:TRINITY_DN25898_c0_g1_i4.p1 TRINITY_DN25898_c0_g1~~TRINITY_DN25898_c0_g1_i4.p1  ORF type:complete len:113 (+),score=12.15 TRINITY_DN25898_c0_g1_i4:78-416(+)